MLLAALLCFGIPQTGIGAGLQDTRFAGRHVADVLADYQSAGIELLYSTGLVRPSLTFNSEPPPGDALGRLETALADLNLALRANTSGGLRVVRAQPRIPQPVGGRVLDADTRQPLAGVRVEIGDQVLITDTQGRFQIPQPNAKPVVVTRTGYQPRRLSRNPSAEDLLEIVMVPAQPMDEIVVVSSRYAVRHDDTVSHIVDLELMDSIPRLGEDPLRITSHLPGMATIGVSAKPHIRGGLQDELLVLFNNLELLEPFHLRDFQSVFSTFNPSLIQTIDVYTGGFPARYGDRMSGVMDIRPMGQPTSGRGELSISFLNTSAMLHGGYAQGRGEWLISGRRGNLDIVTREINASVGEPSYSDWFAQTRFEINPATELDVGLLAYNDDIELTDFDEDGEIAESRYRNLYGWAQLHRTWSPRLDGTSLIYFGSIDHDRQGYLFDEDLDNGEAFVDDRREFSLITLAQSFRYQHSRRVYAEFGLRYAHQDGRYDYVANIERGELASFLATDLTVERETRLRPGGSTAGAFGSVRLEVREGITLEAGLRWDYQDFQQDGAQNQFSPRMSVKFDVAAQSELRVSLGRFFQPEAIHELQIGDGIERYQDVQYADHLIVGWHQQFGESGFSLRTELFAKDFHDPKRRFENLFNPLVLLPELASDRVEIAPERARARGAEMTLKYQPGDQLMAWITFTQSAVEDRIDGDWQPRAWDQGPTVSAGFSWETDRWTLGTTLLWHDGWRTTTLPAYIAEDEVPSVQRNHDRLRDYLSLDLQISRTWKWPRQSLTAFLELTNVLSRRNVGGIEYDVEENEEIGGFDTSSSEELLLPLVPSIGVRWQF